jgi:hypothetical protein
LPAFWAVALLIVLDGSMPCLEKTSTQHCVSCLQFPTGSSTEYLFADYLKTRTKLVCKLFADNILGATSLFEFTLRHLLKREGKHGTGKSATSRRCISVVTSE